MNKRAARVGWFLVLFAVLAGIAWLSPLPARTTDRGVYEATAQYRIVPDCSELHCFRVLVPWVLGSLPGPSLVKWKLYAAAGNAAAAVAVFELALLFGLSQRGAGLAMFLSAFGFGSLYTLFDSYTADPLMYWLAPLIMSELLRGRLAVAGVISTVGVLGKEFAAAPLGIFTAYAATRGQWLVAARALAWANFAFLVWLAWQLTLIIKFNYGYGENPSTDLMGGGYLKFWLSHETTRGAAVAIFNEFGPLYLLAAAGLLIAPSSLRRLALLSLPVAFAFVYVQQPDRALWNFHFLVVPLSALVLERVSAALAWSCAGLFAFANLRIGAQLESIPASRYALLASIVVAIVAIVVAWRKPAPPSDLAHAAAA